ncbi:MAG: iron ABC transporter permease [Flavobacteriaceae bacterium]|jgi:iron complex transport system permease protein|nr:iron ABC transporter permease [Flavobacteriaceae bacterium]
MFSKKISAIITFFVLFCAVLFVFNLFMGFADISFSDFFSSADETKELIINYRINKTLSIILAGITLPVSGFLLQELFKNPLADASILGVSSASALAVALIIFLGIPQFFINNEWLSGWTLVMGSLVGSFLVSLLLLLITNLIKDVATFIIIGFLISSLCGSLVGALQFYSQSEELKQYVIWSFGSLSGLSNVQIMFFFICTVIGLFFAGLSVRMLTGFLLGEEYSKTLGINIKRMKIFIILAICFLVGSATAMLGPIMFIGIIIPHFCRQIWNPASLWIQLILNILFGIGFMLLLGIIMEWTQLPVNILSSVIGVPTILFMIFNSKFKHSNY